MEKSRYEHTDVSIRLKLFLPLSFLLKDLVGSASVEGGTTTSFYFSIARSVRVISTAQL